MKATEEALTAVIDRIIETFYSTDGRKIGKFLRRLDREVNREKARQEGRSSELVKMPVITAAPKVEFEEPRTIPLIPPIITPAPDVKFAERDPLPIKTGS